MRNKNGVFTNRGIHALCALPHTLQVISKCLLLCGICMCMRPTLSQQPLHAHVGVQLEYTHMLPYAGTVQSCSDDISPSAAGHNRQNLPKIATKHHNQAAKGQELECWVNDNHDVLQRPVDSLKNMPMHHDSLIPHNERSRLQKCYQLRVPTDVACGRVVEALHRDLET